MRVDASIDLPVPPELAWAFLTRWEDQARWMKDADRVDVLTTEREGLGVRLAVRTRVCGVPAFTEELEVTAWDPPSRLEIAHRSFLQGRGIWTFEGDATGTNFTWVEDVSIPVPVLGELALLVYRPFLRTLMRGALRGLRRYVIAS
jgi:uncharacterized protein YndB with AHSA1/START domain